MSGERCPELREMEIDGNECVTCRLAHVILFRKSCEGRLKDNFRCYGLREGEPYRGCLALRVTYSF